MNNWLKISECTKRYCNRSYSVCRIHTWSKGEYSTLCKMNTTLVRVSLPKTALKLLKTLTCKTPSWCTMPPLPQSITCWALGVLWLRLKTNWLMEAPMTSIWLVGTRAASNYRLGRALKRMNCSPCRLKSKDRYQRHRIKFWMLQLYKTIFIWIWSIGVPIISLRWAWDLVSTCGQLRPQMWLNFKTSVQMTR